MPKVKKEKEFLPVGNSGDGKVRLPRLMGLTHLMVQYNKEPLDETLSKAQDYMIQQWFLSNGNICGVNYNIYSLSNFICCEPDKIQLFMRDRVLSSKIWDKALQEKILNGIMGQSLSWVLEDRMEAQSQVEILKASQGGTYRAFISSELNKAIKLKMETSTSLQSMIRTMSGGGTVNNIFNPLPKDDVTEVARGVTQEEALKLIDEQYGLLQLEKGSKEHLEQNYNLSELPVVVASEQTGMDLDREGLKIMRKDIRVVVDNYKDYLDNGPNEEDLHEIRREVELNIDEDEEDPEFDLYEEDEE